MSTKAEKIEAQARAFFNHRHAVGPVELKALLEARQILKEMIPEFEGMTILYLKNVSSRRADKLEDLIRRAKEVV